MANNTPVTAPFPINPVMTGIAIAYRNQALIADMVLPRVPVATKEFKWQKYAKSERYTLPETLVGRRGRPKQVEFGATEESSSVRDYGLDDPIPNDDITQAAAAGQGYSPVNHAVEGLTDLILLDREVRAAELIFNTANYDSSLQDTLSGGDQWSDYDNSDPVDQLLSALDAPIYRPNVLTLGQAVWTKLRKHPKVVAAVFANGGNASTGGVITREQLAAVLEIEEILVGQGWLNTAKKGQDVDMERVWGNHAALIYRNRLANTQRGITFGFTAQYQGRIAGQMPDSNIGLRGGVVVRVGESVRELIVAPDCGYFFENAIA